MSQSGYTLLIVESPTLARELQKLVSQNVYVIATRGFLWSPHFKKENLKLTSRAIPEKRNLRKLIREEASKAVKIIIATDNDPAGNFIAWTLSKELKDQALFRGNLQALNKTAVETLLDTSLCIDHSHLHKRLENRYIIRELWHQKGLGVNMKTAAVVSIFGAPTSFSHFQSENNLIFKCTTPVHCRYDSSFTDITSCKEALYEVYKPLSTFRLVELISSVFTHLTYEEAQNLLNRLFLTTDPHNEEGLITYPRTEADSFYSDSWETLRHQWIKKHSVSDFIPQTIQSISDSEIAHDSIRPSNLNAEPGYISKHIPSDLGTVYSLIYNHTLVAVSMPVAVVSACLAQQTGTIFTTNKKTTGTITSITPVLTISEFGQLMSQLGVLRPSGFGSFLDKARKRKIIDIDSDTYVKPGIILNGLLSKAEQFRTLLNQLKSKADDPNLKPETIEEILTS